MSWGVYYPRRINYFVFVIIVTVNDAIKTSELEIFFVRFCEKCFARSYKAEVTDKDEERSSSHTLVGPSEPCLCTSV